MISFRRAVRVVAAGVVLALSLVVPETFADVAIPPVARVTDLTGTLSAEQQASLERTLADFEASKGSQIAVLMLPSTKPEEIEQYSIRVADAWKLGRKGVDDGILVLVAKDDHRFRFEVGRGLEGAVTDIDTYRIGAEYLQPRFRAGDYYGGLKGALDKLIGLVNGEPLPPPPARPNAPAGRGLDLHGLFPVILIFGLIGAPLLRSVLGRPLGAAASGGIVGFIVWLLTATVGAAVIAAIAAAAFTLIGGLGGGRRFGGGFPGAFGGGGFGGGGFGGGGSSGSW